MNHMIPPVSSTGIASSYKSDCATCLVGRICLPSNLTDTASDANMVKRRSRILRGEHLFQVDDLVGARLYAIRCGSFKTYQLDSNGQQRVSGFHIGGDYLALDAIGLQRHRCSAVALEDSEVCEIPYSYLNSGKEQLLPLQQHFQNMLSKEIAREQNNALMLRSTRAEQRLSSFLLGLTWRYAERGYSPNCIRLHMSRQDIADFLGLTPESVSRLLFGLKRQNLVEVCRRTITLLNIDGLERLAAGGIAIPANQSEEMADSDAD